MYEQMIFQCPLSKNRIEFNLIDDIVMCEQNVIDEENYKMYFLLLRLAIDELIKKNYKKFNQTVTISDFNENLSNNEKWTIIDTDMILETYIIQCDLINALECVAHGFGIN